MSRSHRLAGSMADGRLLSAAIVLAFFLAAFAEGCSDRERLSEPDDHTASEWTELAWTDFEQGNYSRALTRFDAAIAEDAAYGPAYTGQGWARLARGISPNDFAQALASFDGAVARQQTGPDVPAGRAATHLAIGGGNLATSILDAQNTRVMSPQFVFAHRTTYDINDLHLIEAFAKAAQADWAGALASADAVLASGIQQGNPGTYVVDGTTYTTFEGAVLAHLNKLSASHAG